MPYNYLFDENVRKASKIKLENSIIVIDEAHNITQVAKDSASFDFSTEDLSTITAVLGNLKEGNLGVRQNELSVEPL